MLKLQGFKEIFKRLQRIDVEAELDKRFFGVSISVFLLSAAVASSALIFSYFAVIKHNAFRSYAWDLGIFNQAFWTTLYNGKLFFSTVETLIIQSGSFFGTHFSPILFTVIPLYAIHPAPQTLLILQSFILALGAIPLYKLVLHVLKLKSMGLLFVLVYLLYPPLQGINWFDFHVQAFLPLFFLSAIYFFEKQNWRNYSLFIILALMCEEHACLVVLFMGLYAAIKYKDDIISAFKRRAFKDTALLVSAGTIGIAALWYIMTIWIRWTFFPVNPAFASTFKASSNWAILGATDPVLIPFYVILNPGRAVVALSYDFPTKLGYIIIIFSPLAFRPFFKTSYLIPTIPWFIYSLFSNYPPYYLILYQYPAYIVAFVFAAAIYAVNEATRLSHKSLRRAGATILVFSLMSFAFVSPLSPIVEVLYPESGLKHAGEHEELIHQILTYVPSTASIMTHNNLFPHVSSRIDAYATPTIGPLWNGNPSECWRFTDEILAKVDFVLVDIKSDPFASRVVFSLMKESHGFRVFVSADGAILFKKNYTGGGVMLTPYIVKYDYTTLHLYSGEITSAQNSVSQFVLHFNGSEGHSPMFWYGPRDLLPPGRYSVALRLRVNGTGEIFTASICADNGQSTLASKTFSASDFAGASAWADQTFFLTIDKPLTDFEIRAINLSNSADVYLDCIDVRQIGP